VITNVAFGSGSFNQAGVRSPEASFTIEQRRPTALIAPTETSCASFAAGTASELVGGAAYTVKSGSMLSVAPGVFFYYSKVVAPSDSFTVQVPTSIAGPFRPIAVHDLGQVVLWSSACTKTAQQRETTFDPVTGLVTIDVGAATPGEIFYLGVKYAPMELRGQTVSTPFPTVTYTYKTLIDGAPIVTSWASLVVAPKR
jgi:hypothetical protein